MKESSNSMAGGSLPTRIVPSHSSSCNSNLPASTNYASTPTIKPSSSSSSSCTANCCFFSHGESCKRLENGRRRGNMATGFFYNLIFGQVPSQFEVGYAVAALQNFMHGVSSSSGSTLNWFNQMFGNDKPKMLQSPGFKRVSVAFRLLQTNSNFQRMVVSLATDKAVWDAVLNNKVVRQLRESLYIEEGERRSQSSDEEYDLTTRILHWILEITKTKVLELIESFMQLVNEIFQTSGKEKPNAETYDLLDEKVRSSVLLTIVILLIVVVARAHRRV